MNSRERVINTLKQKEVDRLPRHCWALPAIGMFRSDEYNDLISKYPSDFISPPYKYGQSRYSTGVPNLIGEYTDEWGCTWQVAEPGVIGEVKVPFLKELEDINSYEIPYELLENADLSQVDAFCESANEFVIAGTHVRPFERLQFLRGTENIFMDMAMEEEEFYTLKGMLHSFFVKEMKMWANTKVDGVSFMDDWGTQKSLLISPQLWRKNFKPLYKEYCDILHAQGKFVFFHSDGNIESIYPDLIEIGIDAINSQLFCMDIEGLGEKYAGKVTFWGEIDRQFVLPFGKPEDVRNAVDRVAKSLLKGKRTGVIAQCEWGSNDPKENIEAVFEQWNKY